MSTQTGVTELKMGVYTRKQVSIVVVSPPAALTEQTFPPALTL